MSEDIRPEQAKAPTEHKSREGASTHSGFQPPSKFSDQGSTAEESSQTKNQRGGHDTRKTTADWEDDHQNQARRDAGRDWSDVSEHRPVS